METPNVYIGIHKSIRVRLFDAVVKTGKVDASRHDEVRRCVHELRSLGALLHKHALHEAMWFHPFLAARAPEVLAQLERAHGEHETFLASLERTLDALDIGVDVSANTIALRALYADLARFVAGYLVHMDEEETTASDALARVASPEEVMGAYIGLVNALSPAERVEDFVAILGAANPGEQAAILQSLAGP